MALKDTYLAGLLALLPEAERGKAETTLEGLEANGLRQADYSKLADEAKAAQKRFDDLYTANTEWFEDKKTALTEVDTLRAKVTELSTTRPAGTPPADLPKDIVTKAEFDRVLAQTEQGAVGFIAEAQSLALRHFQQFGEILNIRDLLADKRVQQIGLDGVYLDKFATQIKAKADAAQAVRDEGLRKEGADKARAELAGSRHPYPVLGNDPSALDALEAARGTGQPPTAKSVDDMAHEYARLQAGRVSPAA